MCDQIFSSFNSREKYLYKIKARMMDLSDSLENFSRIELPAAVTGRNS